MATPELCRDVTPPYLRSILIGLVVGITISATARQYHYPTLEFLWAFIASYAFGVIFHEFGHAVMALVVGGTVERVRLGEPVTGRTPWHIRFLGLNWLIHGLPFSGGVHSTIESPEHYRLRRVALVAGGPGANALLLAIGIAATFFVPTTETEPILILVGWMFANGYLCINNLTPRMVRSCGQMVPNDGLIIAQTMKQSDDDIRRVVAASVLARDLHLDIATAQSISTDELLARHQAEPRNIAFLWNLTNRFHTLFDPRYPEYVMKLLALPDFPEASIPNLIDECLTWQLHLGPPSKPEVADELSQRLLKLDDTISTRGTRGSVLVNIGRFAEGKAILQDVLDRTEANTDKSYSLIFLALAKEAEGDLHEARGHALLAREIDPNNSALKRVDHLLEPSAPGLIRN
jgi:hypothetical protein